jgi:hypothetical protein
VIDAGNSAQSACDTATETELLGYVKARCAIDAGGLAGLRQHELDALREQIQRFREPAADRLYQAWREGGDAAIRRATAQRVSGKPAPRVHLLVHHVSFDYRLLGAWKADRA